MPSSVRRWIGAATAAVLVTVALPAITAAQGSDVINACAKAQTGQVRFVSAPSACLPSETPILLNQTGVQGPQGIEGLVGPVGPPGPADLPPVGAFTPMQLVQGAILTCSSTSASASSATCSGAKLNGLDVGLSFASGNRICATVTGGGVSGMAFGTTGFDLGFFWNGTNWTVTSGANPVGSFDCTK